MSVTQRALPLALAVLCGVVGGYYTFQPVFAADALKANKPSQSPSTPTEAPKPAAPASKQQ